MTTVTVRQSDSETVYGLSVESTRRSSFASVGETESKQMNCVIICFVSFQSGLVHRGVVGLFAHPPLPHLC
jgi:hypothetical protein